MSKEDIRRRSQETAKKLFGKGIKMDPPYKMWKEFDRDLVTIFRCSSPAPFIPPCPELTGTSDGGLRSPRCNPVKR